jgi:hypothetical protein
MFQRSTSFENPSRLRELAAEYRFTGVDDT